MRVLSTLYGLDLTVTALFQINPLLGALVPMGSGLLGAHYVVFGTKFGVVQDFNTEGPKVLYRGTEVFSQKTPLDPPKTPGPQ